MASIIIDKDHCAKDGICVSVCPLGILEFGDDGFPRSRKPERCVTCGHCMAVCSREALRLDGVDRQQLVRIDPQLAPQPEQVEQLMRSRRSVRQYRDKPVPASHIQRIIETANMAPSGVNQHPIRWTVVTGREKLRELSQHIIDWMQLAIEKEPQTAAFLDLAAIVRNWPKHDPLRGAPHVVIAHGAKANPMTAGSGPIAMTYFELAAEANGVGTCWAGYLMMAARAYRPLLDALEIPEANLVVAAMMFGYSKVHYRYVPARPAPEVNWVG